MSEQEKRLQARLVRLRREAGDVSTREISRRSHGAVSHTTVHQVMRAESVPSWRSLEAVVAALDGDVSEFKILWMQARDAVDAGLEISEGAANSGGGQYREATYPWVAAMLNLARYYHSKGDKEASRKILTDHVDSYRTPDVTVLSELGRLFWHEYDGAIEPYREKIKAAALGWAVDEIETALGAVWFARRCEILGETDRALRWAHRARSINPHSIQGMHVHGDLLLSIGRYEEAVDVLLSAHRAEPLTGGALFSSLADALKMTGRFEDLEDIARRIYEYRLEKLGPAGAVSALSNYVETLRLRGKVTSATEWSRILINSVEGEMPTEFLLQYAQLLESSGDIDEAKRVLSSPPNEEFETDFKAAYANLIIRTEGPEAGIPLLLEWRKLE